MMEKITYKMIEESHASGYEIRIGFKIHNLPSVTCREWEDGKPGKSRRISAYDVWPKIPVWSKPGTCFFIPGARGVLVYEIDKKG